MTSIAIKTTVLRMDIFGFGLRKSRFAILLTLVVAMLAWFPMTASAEFQTPGLGWTEIICQTEAGAQCHAEWHDFG